MKNITGIIIAFPPRVLSSTEGLGRHLLYLIEGLIENNNEVLIICPKWCRSDLENLMENERISNNGSHFRIVSTGNIPLLLKIKLLFFDKKSVTKFNYYIIYLWRLFKNIKGIFKNIKEKSIKNFYKMAGTSSITIFIIILILLILLLPIIGISIIIYLLFKKFQNRQKIKFPSIFQKYLHFIDKPINEYRENLFALNLNDAMLHEEFKKIAKLAKNQDNIKTWLIPTAFWPDLVKEISNCVIVCPDLIFSDFPVGFEEYGHERIIKIKKEIIESLNCASHVITYSEYVKNNQLSSRFFIPKEKISVIPHGPMCINKSLNMLIPFESMNLIQKRDLCQQIIHNYLFQNTSSYYLQNFDFSGVRFLIYTSQIRPSKNIPMLLKAFNLLKNEKKEPIKLILTANVFNIPSTSKIITEFVLSKDVICLPNLPTPVMAAFYHLATLAVNPTFFEGGFPFTFSEAYSVGTPSIMSRIPVVEEIVTDLELKNIMLFDPYNIDAMVERIYWGLHNRDELYKRERPLFEKIKSRSWARVAQEYNDILHRVGTEQSEVK